MSNHIKGEVRRAIRTLFYFFFVEKIKMVIVYHRSQNARTTPKVNILWMESTKVKLQYMSNIDILLIRIEGKYTNGKHFAFS